MEHKNLHKKLGFTSVTFYLWWFFRSTLSLGAPNWLCEVTAGMAFGSIAVVAVNRLMTDDSLSYDPSLDKPQGHWAELAISTKNEGWILTFFSYR